MNPPDILYAVRPGERNEQLRYSLRSLANLPHNRVFIAGHCPTWVRNVTVIEVRRRPNKFDAIEENVRQGLRHRELGEDVVYFNDDFYVMEPLEQVPVSHGGPVHQYLGVQELKIRMRQTIRLLREEDPLTYDGIHMPLPLQRDLAREIFETMPLACLWRTWYGNKGYIGGVQMPDTKSRDGQVVPGPFMSTSPKALHKLKQYLEDTLPKGSPYV